jgi:hypothetical protein
MAIQSGKPTITKGFEVVSWEVASVGLSVVYFNPGPKLDQDKKYETIRPRDLAQFVVHIQTLLKIATRFHTSDELLKMYLYDKTPNADGSAGEPSFMAAIELKAEVDPSPAQDGGEQRSSVALPEVPYSFHASSGDTRFHFEQDIYVGGRTWVTVVVPVEGTINSNPPGGIYLSGVLIFVASLLLAAWMIHNMKQSIRIHRIVNEAAAEAAIVAEMFPVNIRERLLSTFTTMEKGQEKTLEQILRIAPVPCNSAMVETRPLADLHPYTTVM